MPKCHFKLHSKLILHKFFIWKCNSDYPYMSAQLTGEILLNYGRQRFYKKFQ